MSCALVNTGRQLSSLCDNRNRNRSVRICVGLHVDYCRREDVTALVSGRKRYDDQPARLQANRSEQLF